MGTNDAREIDQAIADRFPALRPDSEWQPDLQRGLALLRERRVAKKRRKRRWGWITAGALAASLPIMAFPITRAFAVRCVSACVQETAAVRQLLLGNPNPSSTFVRPDDRKLAPDFTLSDASGQPFNLSEARGKVVLLNFWATWCAPCEQEIPWFIQFQQANKQRGLTVAGVFLGRAVLVPISEVGSLCGAAVWLATSLAYFRGAGGKATARSRALGVAGVAVAAALLVIVVGSFGPYHWMALAGWAGIGLALWLARRSRTDSDGSKS